MAGVSGSSRRGSATHLVLVEGLGELVDARGHLEALVQDLLGACGLGVCVGLVSEGACLELRRPYKQARARPHSQPTSPNQALAHTDRSVTHQSITLKANHIDRSIDPSTNHLMIQSCCSCPSFLPYLALALDPDVARPLHEAGEVAALGLLFLVVVS